MEEIWKPIVGCKGLYDVSSLGNVRSKKRYPEGKLLIPEVNHGGYLSVTLSVPGKKRARRMVHHLVLETFVEPRPKGMKGLHGPRGVGDNAVDNVYWGTSSQNNGPDKLRDGTMARLKIQPEQRLEIVQRANAGESKASLAHEFHVDPATIRNILLKERET